MPEKELPKSFNDLVTQSELPVLVDFWAPWCGPCQMVSPAIERIASELKDRIVTIKVNVDEKPDVAAPYQVTSIPTIMLFHKGQVLMRLSGARSYESLKSEVESRLP